MGDVRCRLESIGRHIDLQTGVLKAWELVLERMVKTVERMERIALNE